MWLSGKDTFSVLLHHPSELGHEGLEPVVHQSLQALVFPAVQLLQHRPCLSRLKVACNTRTYTVSITHCQQHINCQQHAHTLSASHTLSATRTHSNTHCQRHTHTHTHTHTHNQQHTCCQHHTHCQQHAHTLSATRTVSDTHTHTISNTHTVSKTHNTAYILLAKQTKTLKLLAKL